MIAQEPGPKRGILIAGVNDGGGPIRPRIGKARAERIGPVEASRMHEPVARPDVIPAAIHRAPPPGAAMGMQHALGRCCRAGGVNQKSGIVRRSIFIGQCCRPAFHRASKNRLGDQGEAGIERSVRQALVEYDGRRFAVREQETQLAFRQIRRDGNRNESARDRAEKGEGIGCAVSQSDGDAAAGSETMRRPE